MSIREIMSIKRQEKAGGGMGGGIITKKEGQKGIGEVKQKHKIRADKLMEL